LEKKLKNNLNKIILSLLVLIISLLASSLRVETLGWWGPLVGGVIAILGLNIEKTKILDIGVLLLVFSLFFLIQDVSFNYINLIFILFMIFFFLGLWIFMKRELFIREIETDFVGYEGKNHLEEYKKYSVLYYVKSLFLGLFVATIGGVVAVHSFIGPFSSVLTFFLNVVFSTIVLFALYSVLFLLPKHFAIK